MITDGDGHITKEGEVTLVLGADRPADRPGDWRVEILGSQGTDRWEMKITGPNAFERSYTLEGSLGQHEPNVVSAIIANKSGMRLHILSKSLRSIFQIASAKSKAFRQTRNLLHANQFFAINKIYFTHRYHKATAGQFTYSTHLLFELFAPGFWLLQLLSYKTMKLPDSK